MSRQNNAIESKVREIILLVLKVPANQYAALVRADVAEWDSLKHMELVFALEDQFGVQFDEGEFGKLVSPSAIAAMIEARLAT